VKFEHLNFIKILEEALEPNIDVISLACKYRSKFEGWLKFEILRNLHKKGLVVTPEGERFDILINYIGIKYAIELKTVNMNYRISGIESKRKPVTKNFKSIEKDIEKIENSAVPGKVIFIIFPIPAGDESFKKFIEKVQDKTGFSIKQKFLKINSDYEVVLCESEVIKS